VGPWRFTRGRDVFELRADHNLRAAFSWASRCHRSLTSYAREQAGITDPRKVFHSFRHTFKRQCRECGIPKDIHGAITGHPSGDVADRYGGAYPLRPLADAMRRLRYDGLDLSGVQPWGIDWTLTVLVAGAGLRYSAGANLTSWGFVTCPFST
jgi:integrase